MWVYKSTKEEREKRQKKKNTEKGEENAEQRDRKEEAFIEKDAMWHRQQDRAGKHSHLSTPRFCPIRHRESDSASNRQGGQSTERSRAASGGGGVTLTLFYGRTESSGFTLISL